MRPRIWLRITGPGEFVHAVQQRIADYPPPLDAYYISGVANTVDGAIEIHPSLPNLDVGFVNMLFSGDGSLASIETLQQLGREVNDPAVVHRMIDADATLSHYLLQVAQAEAVRQIPADAKQDH